MSAITVASPVPAISVLVSEEGLERIDFVLHASGIIARIPDGDEMAFRTADEAYQQLQALSRSIESTRETLKRPALDFGRKLDATARDAVAPIELEKDRLGAEIKRWQVTENARRAEAARLARLEQERLQREADAKAEAERMERVRLAEEQRQRELDAMPKEDPVPGEDPLPMDDLPPVDQEFLTAPVRPVIVPAPYIPPPVTSSVREKKTKVLVIDDLSKIPREINGAQLLVPDESQIKRLLIAGVKIPGCRLDEMVGTAPTGR